MYFLSFETSTKIFSLALSRDEKVLRFRNLKSAMVLEDAILPAVDKMLGSAKVKFNQIDAFAVALGPGSFTSLRVGLSTIKAFAMTTGRPVVGIPSLDIIAKGAWSLSGDRSVFDEICVINDARRGNVYACLYGPDGPKSGYMLTTLDNLLKKVEGKTLFVGDALPVYRKEIEKSYKVYAKAKKSSCKYLFADEKWWYPQARVMAQLVYQRLKNQDYDNAQKLLPLYLYAQDCQVTSPK